MTGAAPAIVSHRNTVDPGTASPAIDRLIERTTRNVEFLLRNDSQFGLPDIPRLERPSNADDAERAAAQARTLLAVDDRQPLTSLSDAATASGFLTFSFDLGTDAADAASILLEHGAVIVVNGALHTGRRRLALAHDIGHCIFADEYTIDWNATDHDDSSTWEARLDRFARALLLPAVELQRSWQALRKNDDTRTAAVKLASSFRVDMSTLARRLSEIGQVDSGEAHQIRTARTTRADIVELNLLPHDEIAAPSLPRVYEQSVLRLYRNATVSAARATDLLFDLWEEGDLPVLPLAPEDAIWGLVL